MADPGPAFRTGPGRARASALSESLIVYDGSRLLHWLNPFDERGTRVGGHARSR